MELTRFINRSAGMFSGFLVLLLLVLIGCGGDGDESNGGSGGVTFTDAVVFLAQKDDATVTELYVSYDNGTAITVEKLSGTLVTSGQVVDFAISPDGQRVVYKADQQIAGIFELYVVSVIGGTAINVSRQPGNVLEVEEFAWSFDSSAIAFRAFNPEPNTGGNFQLFTTLPTGGSPARVSFFTGPDTEVRDFAWSPSSLLLAYTQNPLLAQPLRYDLYSTRPFRQDNNKLSNAPGTGAIIATVTDYAWSPGTSLIAFVAGVDTVGINELFVADASTVNPAPLSLSGTLQDSGEVIDFEWRPDNFRVAYSADQMIDNRIDLFTVVVDGSGFRDVSGLSSNNSRVIDFAWAPNSSRIAFIADRDTVDVFELYTNTSVGNSPRKVSDDLFGGEDVQAFAWAPDSAFIAYQANQDEINKDELYTTSPDVPGDFTKVSGGTPTAGGLISPPSFAWSPDSSLIAYIAEQAALSSELYTSTPDGTTNQAVAPVPLPSGGNVDSFEWEPDSTRVAYLAPQDTINVKELYSSNPDGTDNIKISGDLVTGGNVTDIYEWVP